MDRPPHLVYLKETVSTQTLASQMLARGELSHATFVVAGYQTQGRGYASNTWYSSPKTNLLGTLFIEYTSLPAQEQFTVTTLVSVAIARFLEKELQRQVFIKWPNDIFVNDRKICGLLIENQIMGNQLRSSLIGIGLNVNEVRFPNDLPRAVSMFQLDGKNREIKAVAYALASSILGFVETPDFSETSRREYLSRLYRKDKPALYKTGDETFEGIIRGVDVFGRLVIENKGGMQTFRFKEVEYLF